MIHITFTPVRMDTALQLLRLDETLLFNGTAVTLADLAEGEALDAGTLDLPWLTGEVARRDGALYLTVLLPHAANAPEQTLFPAPITLTENGPVDLPPYAADPVPPVTGLPSPE